MTNNQADKLKEFSKLIDEHRHSEAFVLFLEQVQNKSWSELSTPELTMLDMLCQGVIPGLLEQHTLWMVKHPDRLHRMLILLTDALTVNYRCAATIDYIAWFRCLLAISEAMAGRLDRVHEELCLAHSGQKVDSIPKPNGTFRQQIQSIELTEKTTIGFLNQFFTSYMEFLRRVGQYELSNQLENRIERLICNIARDEQRPGVVQALFYDKDRAIGDCGFIHVSIERRPRGSDEIASSETIQYAGKKEDIDADMQQAASYAFQAADLYLKRADYPDGLTERLVRWEITNIQGDTLKLGRRFEGGSAALPLAVAIISEYLARPVSNDIAFTGAFTEASIAEGRILPVDGVPEKVKQAVLSENKLIYVPGINIAELTEKPALQNLIREYNSRIVSAETLDQVCKELFPPEGSGRLQDMVKDTAANFIRILIPLGRGKIRALHKNAHERHYTHLMVCSILTAALIFLEGSRLYMAFAPTYPSVATWARITVSTVLVISGMFVSFALPAACLRHRNGWSWYAGIAVLAVCFGAGLFLLGAMLPDFTNISSIYNAPPVAGLVKDVFIMWLFAWALAINTFNAVAALEDLVARRQFVTARTCFRWKSSLESHMPLRCIHFRWIWGLACCGIIIAFLLVMDLNYYAFLNSGTTAAYWETLLGIVRDVLFIAAVIEVMVFYNVSVSPIRKALE